MKRNILTSIAAVAAMLLAVGTLGVISTAKAAPSGSPWGANYFPDVPLVTQDGKTVRFYSDLLKEKIVVVNFMFTQCGIPCALQEAKLVDLQQALGDRVGKDIYMYSITHEPARDTPAVLKAYAEKFHVGPGWTFLTGEKAVIDLLRKKLGLYREGDLEKPSSHTTTFVVGNEATGQWMRSSAFDDLQYVAVILGDWLSEQAARQAVTSPAETPKLAALVNGAHLFQAHCAACHTIGQGVHVGPDLRDVTARRDLTWLAHWLADPDEVLAAKDPIASALFARHKSVSMPDLDMSKAEVTALIRYLEIRR